MKFKGFYTKYGTVTEKNGWYYISSNEHGHRGKALQIRLKMQRDWVRRTESEIEALQKRIDGQ